MAEEMEFLHLQKAIESDFPKIRAFYDNVIDGTKDMTIHARWKKGSHPFDDTIKAFIESGDMYMALSGDVFVGVFAMPFFQGEEYHPVEWGVDVGDNEAATLHIFAVSPEFQRKGHGRRIIELALREASAHGMKALRLDALLSNTPAQRLYESAGFRLMGKQHLYADNTGWTDFIYYEKIL